MKRGRRQFIGACAAAAGAAAISPRLRAMAASADPERLSNWAGNYRYSTAQVARAASAADVQRALKAHAHLKVLGSRHCFNGIADSEHQLLSLEPMHGVAVDRARRTVTVEAGVRYGQLCPRLDAAGFALHNLASLPHISIAGACATATHGSGVSNGNLATAVSALEMVQADGTVLTLSREREGDRFNGSVVHLGALGVVTRVTLDVQPAFSMRQDVYLDMPMAALEQHFDRIVAAGYSVSLFTDWQKRRVNEVWIKRRMDAGANDAPAEFFGARAATVNVHPIVELSAEHCTEQLGVPGPWYERLPHFRMGFTPSSGRELQSEYFVPRRHAVDAILAVERLGDRIGPHLLISELRTVRADELWMSPGFGHDTLAIHFTWKQEPEAVGRLMPQIERELAPYGVRPHWGKLFTIPRAELRKRYPRYEDFEALVRQFDPRGRFRNRFLADVLLG